MIALHNGTEGMVGVVQDGWFSKRRYVRAKDLVPMPMAYFHNQVPK